MESGAPKVDASCCRRVGYIWPSLYHHNTTACPLCVPSPPPRVFLFLFFPPRQQEPLSTRQHETAGAMWADLAGRQGLSARVILSASHAMPCCSVHYAAHHPASPRFSPLTIFPLQALKTSRKLFPKVIRTAEEYIYRKKCINRQSYTVSRYPYCLLDFTCQSILGNLVHRLLLDASSCVSSTPELLKLLTGSA